MLQAALAEASKGNIDSTKEDMIRLTTTMQARIIQKFDDLEAEAYKNLPFWYRIWYRMRASKPLRTRVDVDDRREKGKMGFTAAIQGGRVIEKAGVGVTMLAKKLNARMAKQMAHNHPDLQKAIEKGEINNLNMWVNGISCIVHPVNPKAPTVHFNYRHFQITRDDGSVVAWWFGGGQDLTPIYLYDEDAKNVHVKLKKACDKHNPSYYPKFKKWADEYFYHKARREARGIGGIFFDDLDDNSKQDMFKFVKDCADSFEPSYFPILEMRSKESYSAKEKEWQALRHGRYVEFNLVYDRGTKFGFQVPGVNIEAVLMSLPLTVGFMYKHVPEIGSQEERLLKTLTGKPRDW
eukprot:CAMPEP_0114504092 /NCGR_PEP_ID=MMETSP0109-20121206/10017_1 /TAXON_ID=29199 /ORGANISM="Chlorarachnion reptans, Strain CCCM449" /LENGTH=349 /DNA_ID=CAMNT_0001682205 /DNA_START=148 /DNA_END=1194 /DNA_ORIENTATION=-